MSQIYDRIQEINMVAAEYTHLSSNYRYESDARKLASKYCYLKSSKTPNHIKNKLGPNWKWILYGPSIIKKAPFLLK